ncbi:MAG TPA: response regulator receiver protein [Pseudolabrys sp.]|nr:response regulator receiver protein [Pseudolabrys sp.]
MQAQPPATSEQTRIVVLTGDADFESAARTTFSASNQIELTVVSGKLGEIDSKFDTTGAAVIVIDLDAERAEEMQALSQFMARNGDWPPVIAVTQSFDQAVARTLLQMRISDFLVKPVAPVDLVRACARVTQASAHTEKVTEAQIYTFLPAVGGAGVTTLAIQTAMLLLNSNGQRNRPSTCLVDLDFQHGNVADYLDLEPRLNLGEIEPRPERLDRQLLEVMLSHHASGLAVVAAPNRPAEMRTFDPNVVTRLLDLVSTNFEYVVFDMPRTWFSWTDGVLLGSNKLFIISETTVPALRNARQLVTAIRERLDGGPAPQVVVNRFQQKMFTSSLHRSDLENVLGEAFAGAIPNDYALVREAIDRGVPLDEVKPNNAVTQQLKKLVLPPAAAGRSAEKSLPLLKKLKLSFAR